MTRYTKEKRRHYLEKTRDMIEEDKKGYDLLLALQESFDNLVRKLHTALFPEEYDFMGDEISDAKRRRQGENPMDQEYIDRMNKKREDLGFLPLTQNGSVQDRKETVAYCKRLITKATDYKAMYPSRTSY